MGSEDAQRDLEEAPECPEELEYLVLWAQLLFGRSGANMAGVNPLSHAEIESWQRLMGIGELHPWEVEGLVALDMILCNPDAQQSDKEKEVPAKPQASWPKRKVEA